MKKIISGFCCLLVLLLSTCSQSKETANPNQDLIVKGCSGPLTLVKGQNLLLKLRATTGTGYIWSLEKRSDLVELQEKDEIEYEPPGNEPGEPTVGNVKLQVIRFTAKNTGSGVIELVYIRPFSPGEVAERCSIRLTVN